MARQFASHAKRVRVNIDMGMNQGGLNLVEDFGTNTNNDSADLLDGISDVDLFGCTGGVLNDEAIFGLLESGNGVEYKAPWKQHRAKGEVYFSRTREVVLEVDGDRAYGWLTYSNEYGLTLNTKSPFVEALIERICSDLRSLVEAHGQRANPRPVGIVYQYEEICTWIPSDSIERVITGLPILVRYCETMDWAITHAEGGRELIVHRLALSWPKLYPEKGAIPPEFVRLAVKLYKTASHNQPYKLEFQVEVPGKNKKGKPVAADTWDHAVRATCLKLMDGFLEFCGVQNTFIWSGQAKKVRKLSSLPYEPAMLTALREHADRVSIVAPVYYIESLRRRLRMDKKGAQDQAVLNLLRSFKRVECEWGRFYADLRAYMLDTMGKGQDDARLSVLNDQARGLRPTRSNLFYLVGSAPTPTTSGRYRGVITKLLIKELGLVEERKHSKFPALLRLTGKAF